MQDSMYITDNILLRTHTSGMQARTLQAHKPNEPFKIIAPGKVYRCDYDATHSPVFHQMEGMIIDMLKDCKSDADVEAQLKALAGRIVLSYGEATPEGQKFELA
jgi:phenylalanyl-tRNA synthetase alpha subunit